MIGLDVPVPVEKPAGVSSNDLQYLDDVKHDIKVDIRNYAIELVSKYHIKTLTDTRDMMIYTSGFYINGETYLMALFNSVFKNNATPGNLSIFFNFVRPLSFVDRTDFLEAENKINLNNCVVNVITGEITDHSPDYNFLYKLDVDYNKDAKCPNIEEFLHSVVNGRDDYNCLTEIIAYTLMSGYKFHNIFVFVGISGHNGKSTCIKLIKKLLSNNCSSVSMQDLACDRFACSDLYGKRANLCADLPRTSITETGVLKQLTGEDSFRAQEKGKKAFTFFNSAKLIFSCNDLPEIYDRNPAIWDRLVLIDFPNQFRRNKEDKDMLSKITTKEEFSGLINICIGAIKRFISNNSFTYNHESTMSRWEDYREKASPNLVDVFFNENVEFSLDSWVSKTLLYELYQNFCEVRGITPFSNNKFSRSVIELYSKRNEVVDFRPTDIDGKRIYAWKGIKVSDRYEFPVKSLKK